MREPGLIYLINLLTMRWSQLTILFFSREAVDQNQETPLKQQNSSTKQKFQTHIIKEKRDSGKRDKVRGQVCDDHHDIEECQVFMSQTMEHRSKGLYRKTLCYGCLGNISKEHNAKSCANRMCKICSGRHPTVLLHGLKIQKYKKKGLHKLQFLVQKISCTQNCFRCMSVHVGNHHAFKRADVHVTNNNMIQWQKTY